MTELTFDDIQHIFNPRFKEENHVRVVHLFDKMHPFGGVTLAYMPILHDSNGDPTGDFAYVSIAYCKSTERYSRKFGARVAIMNLAQGHSLKLPIYRHGRPVRTLINMIDQLEVGGREWTV